MKRNSLLFSACILGSLLLKCANMGGAGEETTNGIVSGMVIHQNGTPAARTMVALYPAGFDSVKNSDSVPVVETDDSGSYQFSGIHYGTYTMVAVQRDDRTRAMVSDITIAVHSTIVPTVTLKQCGTIKVSVPLNADTVQGYVYVPGSDIVTFLSGNQNGGFIVLDSVPAGIIPSINYSAKNSPVVTIIRYNVPVTPGDTTTVLCPSWKYSRHLVLNTTSSGANVSGNVINFPVLVRLTSVNFKFSQAKSDGGDIRFLKPDNTFLPYEIERWDSTAQKAEIWVKVDTVFGNNNSQSILMYWGNSTASDSSNSAVVFDTANGFAGVWHMNEYPAGAGSIKDRTKNAYHGTPTGMGASASVEGIIGNCLDFDGISDYITLPTITTDFTGGFTACGWMKYRTFNSWSRLIDFGVNGANNNNIDCGNANTSDTLHWGIWNGTTTEISIIVPGYFVLNQWVYVTGTYDGTVMHVYKNGALVGSINNSGGLQPASRATSYIAKSNWAADALYSGSIDEIQVSKTARSADWITLSYMNQKASDALVVFGQ